MTCTCNCLSWIENRVERHLGVDDSSDPIMSFRCRKSDLMTKQVIHFKCTSLSLKAIKHSSIYREVEKVHLRLYSITFHDGQLVSKFKLILSAQGWSKADTLKNKLFEKVWMVRKQGLLNRSCKVLAQIYK